uniref:Uncharacterized protein n=1 Tax=Sphaerodactylus townsendi TaxID=933632 RepID=A0ACB8G5F7_9SAUR
MPRCCRKTPPRKPACHREHRFPFSHSGVQLDNLHQLQCDPGDLQLQINPLWPPVSSGHLKASQVAPPSKASQARAPTVSSSQGDRRAVDRDRHGVVLAAVEMMLGLSLRGGRGRGGRRIHAGGTPRRADDASPKDGAHPQGPGRAASRGFSQGSVLHGQMRRGKPTDRAGWMPAGQRGAGS